MKIGLKKYAAGLVKAVLAVDIIQYIKKYFIITLKLT